jgi:hypothetical protein
MERVLVTDRAAEREEVLVKQDLIERCREKTRRLMRQ